MTSLIKQPKLSDVITEQLESMILDGTLVAGEKLLPERLLAEKFQVSRPSLREAIQNLTAKGLIERKQGGGTFVSQSMNRNMTDPLLALVASRPETQFDLLEFRHSLEGMAAFYAALRGQPDDYQALQVALDGLPMKGEGVNADEEAQALASFYLTMAKAAHNMVLLQVMQTMQEMLVDNIKRNLSMLRSATDVEVQISEQRRDIVLAIVSGDPVKARNASHKHLAFVEKTLLDINKRDANVQRSLRRIITTE
ncbi:GntR family transcriptional regulator [Agaribacter flavus]|uniref:Pyruvate dehydrogenase complex repressor n=1 Tax=Agaribacter flavus TaxID=1902781 RepID=A0ABV7FNU0_9ALTE